MRFLALATDYDETLAHDGRVDEKTLESLELLRSSGRELLLVTGRIVDDLIGVFPRLDLFQIVVGENGGVLYWPETRRLEVLAVSPPPALLEALKQYNVSPLSVGNVLIATRQPHDTTCLEVMRTM